MKLGKKALEALQAEIDGRLMPGDELIVAGLWLQKELHGSQRIIMTDAGCFVRTVSRGCCEASGGLRNRNRKRE